MQKMWLRVAPSGANLFWDKDYGRPWRGDPFEKKDGAKILIFYDFRIFSDFTPIWPPIDASGLQVGAID